MVHSRVRDQQKPSQAQLKSAQIVTALSPNSPNGAEWGLGTVASLEVNGNTLRLKPKVELVLGTKAKHPHPVGPPGIKAQTGSQSWFPELVPQVQLLRAAGASSA